jgi:hypothetical protein
MFKAGTIAGLTSAQSLVHDTQKDVNKESIADHKERNSITRNLNEAHHGVRPLVEISILHLLILFFWYFFLILYDLNRKHTNFQLNWTEDMAYRNYTFFSTKFKAPSRVWVSCLKSRIWASSHRQPWLGWGLAGCKIWFYPIFKKVPQSEFVCKSYDRFTEARPGYGSGRQNMTRNQNRVRRKLAVCDGKCWSNGWKGSNRVSQWI